MPDHVVPLSRQALEVLDGARVFSGHGGLVFPSVTNTAVAMSENALGYLINRAGFAGRQTAHGWRATFSSIMNGHRPGDAQVIELMLAHSPPDKVAAAYNRGSHAAWRAIIAQEWADLICAGRVPVAELVAMTRR